jgi:CBS domain-containing protein
MHREFESLPSETTVGQLVERGLEPSVLPIPIVDDAGRLVGMISQGDILRASEYDPSGSVTLMEAGNADPLVAYEDENLTSVIVKMLQNHLSQLPVVSPDGENRLIGLIDRTSLMKARLRWYEEEHVRETHLRIGGR